MKYFFNQPLVVSTVFHVFVFDLLFDIDNSFILGRDRSAARVPPPLRDWKIFLISFMTFLRQFLKNSEPLTTFFGGSTSVFENVQPIFIHP